MTTSEISVVLTGQAGEKTKRVIESARKFLPGARVILCSWKPDAQAFSHLVDECLMPDEPPALWPGHMLNMNKQLVAVQTGLERVHTPFTLKIRTDTVLTRNGFIDPFNHKYDRDPAYRVFKDRIVISNLFTANSQRPALVKRNLAYHPSDIAMFGRTDDLLHFWSAPVLAPTPPSSDFAQISPEQYLFTHAIRASGQDIASTSWMNDREAWRKSERYLIANFHLVSYNRFGFIWPRSQSPLTFCLIYGAGEWRSMISQSTVGKDRWPCDLETLAKECVNLIYLHGGRPLTALRCFWHAYRAKYR